MAIYTSNYTQPQIDAGVGLGLESGEAVFKAVALLFCVQYQYEVSSDSNPNYQKFIVDADGKIVAGLRNDGSVYIANIKSS